MQLKENSHWQTGNNVLKEHNHTMYNKWARIVCLKQTKNRDPFHFTNYKTKKKNCLSWDVSLTQNLMKSKKSLIKHSATLQNKKEIVQQRISMDWKNQIMSQFSNFPGFKYVCVGHGMNVKCLQTFWEWPSKLGVMEDVRSFVDSMVFRKKSYDVKKSSNLFLAAIGSKCFAAFL